MKVMQTKFKNEDGTGTGNCLRACVATLLQIGLEDIPEEMSVCDFLLSLGLAFEGSWEDPDTLCIAIGKSTAGDWDHAVLWCHGRVVHNPNPHTGSRGIEEPDRFFRIVRID